VKTTSIVGVALTIATAPARADVITYAETWCDPAHDVVGESRCLPYASWSRTGSNVFAEFGFHARHIPHRTPPAVARRVGTPPPGSDTALGFSFVERIAVRVTAPLYVGIEGELGTPLQLDGDAAAPIVLLGGAAVAGLRVPLPFGALAGEVAGGGRIVGTQAGVDTWSEPTVELRGRLGVWLSPWCSLGVVVGKSVLREGEWMTGLVLGVDTYAFGLDRSR
jgi:hypothetical protein